VLARYIKALLQEGHSIEFYIEGGRSRNGKMTLPKMGFLSILLQAYSEGCCKDLIFVPTSIIYDRIIEEDSYLKEIGGARKEKEDLKQFIGTRRFLKRRYGKIYIRFNEPFSLNEYISTMNPELTTFHQELATHITTSINEVSLVTPLSLISTAILTNHRKGFLISELQESVHIFIGFLHRYNITVSTTLNNPSKAILETISLLISWKIVNLMEDTAGEEETFYFVEDDKKLELEYYKNNIIHFFIYHSFVAISLLSGSEESKSLDSIKSDYTFLKEVLSREFIVEKDDDISGRIKSIIEYFLDEGLLIRSDKDGGYKITRQGFDKVPSWAALAKTFIEAYWISAKVMGQKKSDTMTEEMLLKNINYLGKRYYKLGVIEHIAAISRISFQNAVSLINKNILSNSENPQEYPGYWYENLSQITKRLFDLSHYVK
jgi:glycerol-3-phosphate O-acyltransferase